jgi:hypothetical protein
VFESGLRQGTSFLSPDVFRMAPALFDKVQLTVILRKKNDIKSSCTACNFKVGHNMSRRQQQSVLPVGHLKSRHSVGGEVGLHIHTLFSSGGMVHGTAGGPSPSMSISAFDVRARPDLQPILAEFRHCFTCRTVSFTI